MDRPSQLTNMMLALYNNIVSYGCKMSVNLLALYDDFKQQWSLLYRNVFYQDIWCGQLYMLQGLFMFLNNCCSNKKCCQTVNLFMLCFRGFKDKISANDIECNQFTIFNVIHYFFTRIKNKTSKYTQRKSSIKQHYIGKISIMNKSSLYF